MLDYKVKIGLVPERRWLADGYKRKGIFNPQKAVDNKNKVVKYITENFSDDKTEFVNLDFLNDEGLLVETGECAKIRDEFKKQNVDAIFIINCNFGNEEAAGTIAKMMNLPTLLWGPRDTVFEPDGTRYTDCQCGLFAVSKQLRRYGIPFSYIENCPVEDEIFSDGLKRFLSVVCMVKNFKKLNILSVGTRLNPFKSVMANELELTEKFGFNMNTMNMSVFSEKIRRLYEEKTEDINSYLDGLKSKYKFVNSDDETVKKVLALALAYKEAADESGADVISAECWTATPPAFGVYPCLAFSVLADMGCIVTCESDVYGAVSNVLAKCAARGEANPLFGEFTVRHPEDKNAELLWHCGPFPYSSKKDGVRAELINTKPSFRAKDGRYTICRFQGDRGNYTLLCGRFDTTDGPYTTGTHMWAKFGDLSAIEKKLINGPYIHHMTEVFGDYYECMEEFCKFIPELEFDALE